MKIFSVIKFCIVLFWRKTISLIFLNFHDKELFLMLYFLRKLYFFLPLLSFS